LIMKRFQLDLLSIRKLKIFTDCGNALRLMFEDVFDRVYRSAKDLIVGIDLSNQPYAFSYDQFVALNPLSGDV